MKSALRFAAFLLAAAASLANATLPPGVKLASQVEGITEYTLPNGLRILLFPDASKPTTTVNTTYLVGSRHENYGETGMAHLLEHLMFKGSPAYPQVWKEFTRRGMRANGSTWTDRTNYFASFNASEANLDWYLAWSADAMTHSFIARKDLDTEMTVVRNELEMGESQPFRSLLKRVLGSAYDWHSYGKDAIGARADVENVSIPRLQAFYRQYYQPDNAVLILTGKFDEAKAIATIARTFGKIARPTRRIEPTYTLDTAQDGERSVTVRRVGDTQLILAAYHIPAAASPDFAAISMLQTALGDTPTFDEQLAEVKGAQLDQLKALHAIFYGGENGHLAIVGDFDVVGTKTLLASLFGDWKSSAPYTRVPRPLVEPTPATLQFETPDKANAYFAARLGFAMQDDSPDYATAMVVNRMIGGEPGALLWQRIREKEGLSYGVFSQLYASSNEPRTQFDVSAIYAPQNREKLEAAFNDEMARLLKEGFAAEKLKDAKAGLLQARRLEFAQDSNLAYQLVNGSRANRTMAYDDKLGRDIEAVTLAQANALLRKYIDPAKFVTVRAGDFAKAVAK